MRFLPLLLLLTGCPDPTIVPPDAEPPPKYLYSAPDETMNLVPDSSTLINEAAGCKLVGKAEAAPFVNPIIVVDEHYLGPSIVGCAWMNEATKRLEMPRNIEIVRWALTDEVNVMVFAHEIGHTLGLGHTAVETPGIMNPFVSDSTTWAPESELQLEALCIDTPADMPEELVVDRTAE